MYYFNAHGNLPVSWSREDQDFRDAKSQCQKYMNYHVIAQMKDGSQVEGIIEDMDDEGVTMMVPEDVEENDSRTYGYGGYGGYGRRRFRRYRRRRFPFYVFAFPFIFPYPFYY
ncbi:hypothetical protein DFO73_106248 [Cytobacillus oceanisediminis]|jgi:hypothetical protein|uniref:Uncharacterized protein n=1 Tax=Cytobacillus oceanisediminis TaxID=665099 RepID=A0A2V2ZVI9_9BACI|nr:hypothetical protein [Cytobacillus oceanisediminis]PWW28432.1 hypothetical protein DFO73_106248 [Cytobacillus oceanisediminis]